MGTECTGLTTGGVTVMLDRLEKAGFIKRAPNPTDRRSVLVRVNPRKVEKIHAAHASINEQMESIPAATPERDLEQVISFFARMNDVRREQPARNKS